MRKRMMKIIKLLITLTFIGREIMGLLIIILLIIITTTVVKVG
jgi:hypothetical protein